MKRALAFLLCLALFMALLAGCQAKEEQPREIDCIQIERKVDFLQRHRADVTITDKAQIREFLDLMDSVEFREPEEWEIVYDMDMPGYNYITLFSDGEPVTKYFYYDRFLGIGIEREKMTSENAETRSWPGVWLVMTWESTEAMDSLLDELATLDPPLEE